LRLSLFVLFFFFFVKYFILFAFSLIRASFVGIILRGKQIVVLDIGANAGYYGLMAAAQGHKVIFLEPQPHCLIFLQAAVYLNQFGT